MPCPPSRLRIPLPAWLAALSLALLLAGCGFQPRGAGEVRADIPGPVFISGISPYSDLYRELERQLGIAGVPTTATMADSASVLQVEDWQRESRLLSVNSRNRAVEFELEESAMFRLRARDGAELVAMQRVHITRIQFRPETAVLGSGREAEMLREDMVSQLAGQIVRRLAAQH